VAADALAFYERVLQFQGEAAGRHNGLRQECPLREQIEVRAVSSEMREILSLSVRFGTQTVRQEASTVQPAGEPRWQAILRLALTEQTEGLTSAEKFFARACLQPIAENLQIQVQKNAHYNGSLCPACDGLPQMAVLRPEGEGASRSLVCSFCLCEWTFRRLVCPWCGEEDKEKLPRYSAGQYTSVHVEACDACLRYLKAIDMTVDGHAVPLVDEAASAVLDVWAVDRGYTKIVPNLIGF